MVNSTREGEVDAADKLMVEETRQNELCFFIFVVIVKCMGRENGYLKVLSIDRVDRNFAVHNEGAARKRARLSNKLCLVVNRPQVSSAP